MAKLNSETIQAELTKLLEPGENLLVWGYATFGLKSLFVGLTDRRLLVDERHLNYEEKALEVIPLATISAARVTKGPMFPIDRWLASLLMQRDLHIKTLDGRWMRLAFQQNLLVKKNKEVAAAMLAELQARIPGLLPK
jgi:hypothetical protein